jgi:hypothetical protein
MARIHDMRGGKDYDSTFGTRMRGEGVWAQLIAQRLAKAKRRFGLDDEPPPARRVAVQEAPGAEPGGAGRSLRLVAKAARSALSGSKKSRFTWENAARKLGLFQTPFRP